MSSIMKGLVNELDLFNRWKDFGTYYGSQFVYRTTTAPESQNLFMTYVKHKQSGIVVCRAYGMSEGRSISNAAKLLQDAGVDAVRHAIETKTPIEQKTLSKIAQVKKDIEHRTELEKQQKKSHDIKWWDGTGHRDRAQKKIVGEKKINKKNGE